MTVRGLRAARLALLAGAAIASGCQVTPRMVIQDLPVDSILEARPAAAPARASRPVRQAPPAAGPREWDPGAYARPWRWIVIHHSATERGSAEIFDRLHRARGWDEMGYHFVITNGQGGADGQVQVGSRWTKQKWGAHCKTAGNDYNNYGIGVCVVGNFSDRLPSRAQLASLGRLVGFLMDRYRIAASEVIGHRDAPGTATECPGDALHRYLHQVLRPHLERQLARSQ
jgi:N-acetylmuramoyl-L-alanine amidase